MSLSPIKPGTAAGDELLISPCISWDGRCCLGHGNGLLVLSFLFRFGMVRARVATVDRTWNAGFLFGTDDSIPFQIKGAALDPYDMYNTSLPLKCQYSQKARRM
jgi:hypothetical protein